MALYNYIAKDNQGNQVKGIVEAANEQAAVTLIKSNGLFVIQLNLKDKDTLSELFQNFRSVSGSEKVSFTRQLATMVAAGLPLPKALEVISNQTTNANMKNVITQCLRDVESGNPLSVSMKKFPKIFPPTYISLLKAGEASGKMQDVLLKLAESMEEQQEFRSKFKGALIYPAIILVAMAGVFAIMMIFVVPKLADMYKSLNAELPLPTRILLGISDFFVTYWWMIAATVMIAFVSLMKFKDTEEGKVFFSKLIFKLPIFGKLSKEKELSEFGQTLSLLTGSGIPIVESLQIAADVVENTLYRDSLRNAAKSVEGGYALSKYLKSDDNFPPIVGQMVSVGEETGQLDLILERLAKYFSSNAEQTIKNLSTAIEPVVLILLGVMVGLLVFSIITPIYNLTNAL